MTIDNRIRATQFMNLLSVGRSKFYKMVRSGEIEQPQRYSEKDVFWYASYVKKKVEEYK